MTPDEDSMSGVSQKTRTATAPRRLPQHEGISARQFPPSGRKTVEKEMKVFYVTHLYEFARGFFNAKDGGAIFLRAEREADGTRTFKLAEGEPLQTSYGQDLYNKVFAVENQTIGVESTMSS